jgi:hypothetical protein
MLTNISDIVPSEDDLQRKAKTYTGFQVETLDSEKVGGLKKCNTIIVIVPIYIYYCFLHHPLVFIPIIFCRTHWYDLPHKETCISFGSFFHGTFLRRAQALVWLGSFR